jgi:hypothetical protein
MKASLKKFNRGTHQIIETDGAEKCELCGAEGDALWEEKCPKESEKSAAAATDGGGIDPAPDETVEAERTSSNRQTEIPGTERPPQIQAIDNCAQEIIELREKRKADAEEEEELRTRLMGLMRVAKRGIYKYKTWTITLEDEAKVKFKKDKQPL